MSELPSFPDEADTEKMHTYLAMLSVWVTTTMRALDKRMARIEGATYFIGVSVILYIMYQVIVMGKMH